MLGASTAPSFEREERGLTQRALTEVSGVRQSNISAIEAGRRVPTADTLNRLVVACGFELAATAGDRVIYCPFPVPGGFPARIGPSGPRATRPKATWQCRRTSQALSWPPSSRPCSMRPPPPGSEPGRPHPRGAR
ncbi:MAG: helix-turn-helix domain-containing protein [Acidimicrobiales bacterium]